MYKIVALIGEAGSGKDSLLHKIIEKDPNLHEIISCTTRPKRDGEVEGVNYFYLTKDEFLDEVQKGKMFEATFFNEWFYGTGYKSLDENKVNVGVFNPTGIKQLIQFQSNDINIKVFYVNASAKTRLLRQLNREKNPNVAEIIRRYHADEKDFTYLDFPYRIIFNETYEDLDSGAEEILRLLKDESS